MIWFKILKNLSIYKYANKITKVKKYVLSEKSVKYAKICNFKCHI